jgi:Cys-rich protein (TIGR01571 family)
MLLGTGSRVPDSLLYLGALQLSPCGVHGCLGASLRHDIRDTREIDGSDSMDCLGHCVFASCALTQERQELDEMKKV